MQIGAGARGGAGRAADTTMRPRASRLLPLPLLLLALLLAGGCCAFDPDAQAQVAGVPGAPGVAAGRSGGEDDYGRVLGLSLVFYEGQMSGRLPAWNRMLYGRPGGWKRAGAHLRDGRDVGADLSGGFYDAGDYLKCPHALAWALSSVALSMAEFRDGYVAAQQWAPAMRLLKWGLDWLLKAHVRQGDAPADNAFVGQLSARPDHWYFGRPEQADNPRPTYLADARTGGGDLAAQYAAAFAAGAVLFRGVGERDYADLLLRRARQAYGFAKAYPTNWKTPDGVFQAYPSYWPDAHVAGRAWAAAWLCRADPAAWCGEAADAYAAARAVDHHQYNLGWDWDSNFAGASALMLLMGAEAAADAAAAKTPAAAAAAAAPRVPAAIVDQAREHLQGYVLRKWEDTSSKCPQASYSNVCYTPKGLAYYSDWGTLRNTGNAAFLALLVARADALAGADADAARHVCWARSQLRYMTGASTGKSYLIGYGRDQPKRPHHRASACLASYSPPCARVDNGTCCAGEAGDRCCNAAGFMSDRPATVAIVGGLVGGPDQRDVFPDVRNDYQRSEVAVDFNAGLTGLAAGLVSFSQRRVTRGCAEPAPSR